MVLCMEKLEKTYRGPAEMIRAVADISLRLDEGEFAAIVGPSGCGKTTLLLAAGALLRPSGGRVLVAGKDPYRMTPEHRSRFRADKIGFVFQQFHLVPYLTVLENVMAPALAKPRADARDRAVELIRRFHLEHRADHIPASLSTGERQRTALARALLHEPALVLADEPTGNLDRENAASVLQSLKLVAAEGAAVLLVTHDEAVKEAASRVLHMNNGRL